MEAFSLLKYWKSGGGAPGSGGGDSGFSTCASTINVATVANNGVVETDDDDEDGGDDDEGPFFDLEFAVPEEEEGEDKEEKLDGNGTETENENDGVEESSGDGTTDDGEREFNFMLSSSVSNNDRTDANLELSPSDDLFFKGKFVPVESSAINGSEPNSKPQFQALLLKSATKFRVFMLQFKKSKMSPPPPPPPPDQKTSEQKQKQEEDKEEGESNKNGSKFFTVKFKVEEVPIVSLFTGNKSQKQNTAEESAAEAVNAGASDEKRFSKDVMQKYLKKVKPLYIRVSKRYGEKLRLSGQLSLGSGQKTATSAATQNCSPPKSTAAIAEKGQQQETDNALESPSTCTGKGGQKQGNLQAGLRVVCKHLGKSRSASSAVAAVPAVPAQSRRDDSLLQQQDGIQSAILHCKRSFNASRESESSLLSRSVSDPSYEKTSDQDGKSSSLGRVNNQTPPLPNKIENGREN